MLSRREFGGGFAAVAAVRRRGAERPAPPPPVNEPNLARILRTKKLRVGGLLGEEPYFYRNPTGRWSGFLVAMAGELAAALGVELAVVESNWAEMVTDLHTGKLDLAYGPSPTAQRAMFADYAAPLFHDTYAILARKGFAPRSWAEINVPGSLVAVDGGSAREEAVRRGVPNPRRGTAGGPVRPHRLLCCDSSLRPRSAEEKPADRRTCRANPAAARRSLSGDPLRRRSPLSRRYGCLD